MSKAIITISFNIDSVTHADAVSASLYSNSGSGDIDYMTPVQTIALDPDMEGPYKFTQTVLNCGSFKFAIKCFDSTGNASEPSAPQDVFYHAAPDAPSGLKKNSYNPATGVLTLDAI